MVRKSNCGLVFLAPLLALLVAALTGCATNPALVGSVLPGVIASSEKKLAKHPDDNAQKLETARYMISYANAFVEGEANMLAPWEFEKKKAEKARAKDYYLRAAAILDTAVGVEEDTAFIYWKAAGNLAAYAIDPFDFSTNLSSKAQACIAALEGAYEREPRFENGSIPELLFLIYAFLPGEMGGDKSKAEDYYNAALDISRGLHAGLFVTWAEAISVPAQNYGEWKAMLEKALAVKPNADKSATLVNKVNQKKARYLLAHPSYYFVDISEDL